MGTEATKLPFQEAINFHRQKVNLPTERWNQLWEGEHARAFTVAGATRDQLISDLRSSVDQAIAEGTTLDTFRRQFDSVVAKHGWSYKGGRGWRTDVMLNTNVRTAYQAGRYAQMTDPDMLKFRPFWEYVHGDSAHPRPEHLAWNGLVLKADDAWWSTHYPPNGWGCKCKVRARNARDLERRGLSVGATPSGGNYQWTDPNSGEIKTIPNGIDPGWAYNVGEANQGKPVEQAVMDGWAKNGERVWEDLTPGDWQSASRPAKVPIDKTTTPKGPAAKSAAEVTAQLRTVLGGSEKLFTLKTLVGTTSVRVNAEVLGGHIGVNRAGFVPLLTELLESPFEVWMGFAKHRDTGRVVLRYRYIKVIEGQGKEKRLMMVATAREGVLEGWTFIPVGDINYIQLRRTGQLLFGR